MQLLFEEKFLELYGDIKDEEDENENDKKEEELSIEDQIKKELQEIKGEEFSKHSSTGETKKKDPITFIDLNCECVTFCKTRRPIVPEEFVLSIMEDLADPKNMVKRTRYVQKLTPITYSCNAKMEQLIKLANLVIGPHFHDCLLYTSVSLWLEKLFNMSHYLGMLHVHGMNLRHLVKVFLSQRKSTSNNYCHRSDKDCY